MEQSITLPHDILTPEGISIWPLAIGWWLLLIISILAICISIYFYQQYKQKWGYRRTALRLLRDYQQQWQPGVNDKTTVEAMSAVLKRTAMSAYPLQRVNSLYGEKWIDFLNTKTNKKIFSEEIAQFFYKGLYQENGNITIDELFTACSQWIKQHV